MTPQQQEEQKKAARAFVRRWQAAVGSEQQEATKFWIDLFISVLGVPNPADPSRRVLDFERRVKGRRIDVFHEDVGVLIEHKSRGVDLDEPEPRGKEKSGAPRLVTPFEQAKWYADNITPRSIAPRWLITCNFDELRIYDLDDENTELHPECIQLADLPERLHRLSFLTRKENSRLEREKQLSVAVCEPVARLYDELAKGYQHLHSDPHEQRSLNILMTRIVFLLYAEDADLMPGHGGFTAYLRDFKAGQTASALRELFDVLKTPEEQRDPYLSDALKSFPYTNGGLFEQPITIPQFSEAACSILMEAARFDWKDISPTIFGAVFESTLNPATRRAGGMHYTSIENIHKVIDPLFLTELRKELSSIEGERNEGAKTRAEWNFRLNSFRKKLASLRIFDPACGSGNFLTETYLRLRELENRVLQNLYGAQMAFAETDPIQVSIHQFYGVEINDFAVEVAKTALWIAEQQMLGATREILDHWIEPLPLKDNANIHCANALRINWNEVLPASQCSYIIGNPPFLGHIARTEEQSSELRDIWHRDDIGRLDYVTGWYKKAIDYAAECGNMEWAFVSTNSISMGEPVPALFEYVFNNGWRIKFAHRTFVWDSEATEKAHVHVVIIGFTKSDVKPVLYSYSRGQGEPSAATVSNINGYLLDAPNVFIEQRRDILFPSLNPVTMGNMPRGTGLIIEAEHISPFRKDPIAAKYIRRFMMGRELINNEERYCLWMENLDPDDVRRSELLRERIEAVRQFRMESKAKSTREMAETPHLFGQRAFVPLSSYVGIPSVFSGNRKYATCDFLPPSIIPGNKIYVCSDPDGFQFAMISSLFFIAWQKSIGGRLKSDCNFSNTVVWNNFPVPEFSQDARRKIIDAGKAVLDARAAHPGATLAQLYDPDKMPANLREAHHALDAAVEAAYGVNFEGDEEKIVAHLFQLYAQATASKGK